MRLELKTGQTIIPAVTQAGIKEYGYDHNDENDALINSLIQPATDYVEHITGRRMISQSWYIYMNADEYFNRLAAYKNSVTLSTLNVSAITEVLQFDRNNNSTAITATDYRLSGNVLSAQSQLVFNDNISQPVTFDLRRVDSIRIEVVAGYGSAIADIPGTVQTSLKLLANHWVQFGFRVGKDGLHETPVNFDAMLLPYKSTETWL